VHLVGFAIGMYYDARTNERQTYLTEFLPNAPRGRGCRSKKPGSMRIFSDVQIS
jgi:hypothetical protein